MSVDVVAAVSGGRYTTPLVMKVSNPGAHIPIAPVLEFEH